MRPTRSHTIAVDILQQTEDAVLMFPLPFEHLVDESVLQDLKRVIEHDLKIQTQMELLGICLDVCNSAHVRLVFIEYTCR